MNPALVVRLRPTGPWRIGPDSGARNRVDSIYHSDSVYAAVTAAMARLGLLEEWLDATARCTESAVRFTSCFPFFDGTGYIVPPRTLWPPTSPALIASRVRWKSARFVPISIVRALLDGQILDDTLWSVDGVSECLLLGGHAAPFRTAVRGNAAVDRLTGTVDRHATACLEFRPGAGLWTAVWFAGEAARDRWDAPVRAAFRYLADSGFGGERSRGWGRSDSPEFIEGELPDLILPSPSPAGPELAQAETPSPEGAQAEIPSPEGAPVSDPPAVEPAPEQALDSEAPSPGPEPLAPARGLLAPVPGPRPLPPVGAPVWLLSLFSPGPADSVDWSRGDYTVLTRSGRVESPAGWGEPKKQVHMVAEGSVLYSDNGLAGAAPDVAPDGFAHPVFRAGFAVTIPLPRQVSS